MTKETFIKAQKLMGQISSKKGFITTLSQRLEKTKCVIKKAEIEERLLTNIAALSNLRKEFSEL